MSRAAEGKGTYQQHYIYSAADANGKVIDLRNYWVLYVYKEGVVEAGNVACLTMAEGYLKVVFQCKG